MPEPRQPSFSDFVYQYDLLSCSSFLVTSFCILSLLDLPSILRSQLISSTSILLSSSFLRHQHSDPYIITGMTNVPYSFTLVAVVIIYCLTSIFCSLCQTLPRPVRFFALCPSCSGRPPLSMVYM